MSTRQPIRKQQIVKPRSRLPYEREILPQLRLLAPKSKAQPPHRVQHRLQLVHNNIRDKRDTEAPAAATVNVKPRTSADDGFPELSPGNLPSGARLVTYEGLGPSTQYLPYGSSQRQETTQDRYDGDCIPMLNAPDDEVWTNIVQPAIGIYQSQCSIGF